ncbi:nickel ABC transporter substrate-binding protein [Bacillus sp. KH172YL63]|nr:nickel ABC transporter substrate-binding protein [Bacillus sp. KH172YL63]
MSKKTLAAWMMIGFIVLFAAACSSSEKAETEEKKELTFLSKFPSDTMDPHLNYTPVRAGIAETLVKINEELKLEPWLAEKWESVDGGKTWTFTIRDDVTFQNGKKLDAEAVKKSLERNIDVSEAMKSALKINQVEADGQILTLSLEQPLPELPSELVHPNTAIIDVDEKETNTDPVGTGPFKITSFKADSKVELERYEEYWDGKPKLEKVVLTFNDDANARTLALQSGDADVVYRPAFESMEELKKDDSIKADVVPGIRAQMLLYNFDGIFGDKHIRKAFDYMIDREEVVDSTLAGFGKPAGGPFVSELPFANNETKVFDLKEAKKHLAHAGVEWKDGKAMKDGEELSLKIITYSYRPELPLMAQILQSNAKELGIEMTIQQVENIDEEMASKDDWDISTYSLLTAPRGDASYFLHTAYMPGGYLHDAGRIEHKELQKTIQTLNGTVDQQKRQKLAMEASDIINEEFLHSFIVHPSNVVAYKEHVKNWVTSKSEFYMLTNDLDVVN